MTEVSSEEDKVGLSSRIWIVWAGNGPVPTGYTVYKQMEEENQRDN